MLELKRLFKSYDDCFAELSAVECKDYYSEGLMFGVLLGMEIFSSDENE